MLRSCKARQAPRRKGGLPKAPELGSSATSVETTPTLAAAGLHLLLVDA